MNLKVNPASHKYRYRDADTFYRGYFKGNLLDTYRRSISSNSWYSRFLTIYWNGPLAKEAIHYFYWIYQKDKKADWIKSYFEQKYINKI